MHMPFNIKTPFSGHFKQLVYLEKWQCGLWEGSLLLATLDLYLSVMSNDSGAQASTDGRSTCAVIQNTF